MFIFIADQLRQYGELLQEVKDGTRGAVYNGASLTVSDGKDAFCCSLSQAVKHNLPTEIQQNLAAIYINNKTPNHSDWELAQKVLNS
jgi:hypothetical protein